MSTKKGFVNVVKKHHLPKNIISWRWLFFGRWRIWFFSHCKSVNVYQWFFFTKIDQGYFLVVVVQCYFFTNVDRDGFWPILIGFTSFETIFYPLLAEAFFCRCRLGFFGWCHPVMLFGRPRPMTFFGQH